MNPDEFLAASFANPHNKRLMDRGRPLGLPDCWLVAGCLFQPVWNTAAGRAPDWGIKDYDIFYFDPDTSWQAEDEVIRRVAAVTADLGIVVEVKNQARVHLWYEDRFGSGVPPIGSAREGIGRFLVAGTCVGVALDSGAPHAPYGLDDIANGVLRPNPTMAALPTFPQMFADKASAYRKRWPQLEIIQHP